MAKKKLTPEQKTVKRLKLLETRIFLMQDTLNDVSQNIDSISYRKKPWYTSRTDWRNVLVGTVCVSVVVTTVATVVYVLHEINLI